MTEKEICDRQRESGNGEMFLTLRGTFWRAYDGGAFVLARATGYQVRRLKTVDRYVLGFNRGSLEKVLSLMQAKGISVSPYGEAGDMYVFSGGDATVDECLVTVSTESQESSAVADDGDLQRLRKSLLDINLADETLTFERLKSAIARLQIECLSNIRMVLAVVLVMTSLGAGAQRRYDCMAMLEKRFETRGMLGYPSQDWDASRTYRQLVLLVSFRDCGFSMSDPVDYYNKVLNDPGYNEGAGPGSMADYFRDQSAGRFNLAFDVFGPLKVDEPAKSDDNGYYGTTVVSKALKQFAESPATDCRPYDWDSDGYIDQVILILAGYTGNQVDGYIWPNTGSMTVALGDGLKFRTYTLSCELWEDGTCCGIGTICHEFSHCLGLPDLYPMTSGMPFSVVDEWDLMDGGNMTGKGWCPPNYSALERMLLGWEEPRELTSAETVYELRPVGEGGEALMVRHPLQENEYYLLENRRRSGWDYGLPGEGLVIAHVDYDRERWSNNSVNSQQGHYRYDLMHADNRDYRSWDPADDGRDPNKYTMAGNLRNRFLSTSAYPYRNEADGSVNCELTNTSVPASVIPSKPITNIRLDIDGTIAFDFMKETTGIQQTENNDLNMIYYDLSGRRLPARPWAQKGAQKGQSLLCPRDNFVLIK